MAVPKRRMSPARQGARRSHHHRKPKGNTYCNRCGNPVLPHVVCWNCGWSNVQGRQLVEVSQKEE